MSNAIHQLGLFAKFWQPGKVKTRLARSMGDDNACQLYRSFVFHLLKRLEACSCERQLIYSPPEKKSEFQSQVATTWQLIAQSDGDLGARLTNYFESRFANRKDLPDTRVVVIGADCPLLSAEAIQVAFEHLNEVDVVIGPSTDGGYYLIGMNQPVLCVFEDIDWSTSRVLDQSVARLENRSHSYRLLEKLTDVDEVDSLRVLYQELVQSATNADEIKLLREVELALSQVTESK